MKKGLILELIRAHAEGNEAAFRSAAHQVMSEFESMGDHELAHFILAQLGETGTFEPQAIWVPEEKAELSDFFCKVALPKDPFPLPEAIRIDIEAVARVVGVCKEVPMNTVLFYGKPGTGKTEAAKHIARITGRELYLVDFARIVDCKLGQTAKNIRDVFKEINQAAKTERCIFLFDEIDALAMDRINQQDMREMGRATSTMLRCMDELDDNVFFIATTNLSEHFDKALLRRFDAEVNFDRYTEADKQQVAETLLDFYLKKFKRQGRNTAFFRKILAVAETLPMPGDMKNLIKRAIIFSDPEVKLDYLRVIYRDLAGGLVPELAVLRAQGFSLREMEVLTGRSKSQIDRDLRPARPVQKSS